MKMLATDVFNREINVGNYVAYNDPRLDDSVLYVGVVEEVNSGMVTISSGTTEDRVVKFCKNVVVRN